MKFYRVLDMSISKDSGTYGDNKFRVGSYGSSGGVMTSLDECVAKIDREREIYKNIKYGEVTILKDEITEFQAKLVEHKLDGTVRETIYAIKVEVTDINI